jgi:hypothetical protein
MQTLIKTPTQGRHNKYMKTELPQISYECYACIGYADESNRFPSSAVPHTLLLRNYLSSLLSSLSYRLH